MSGFSSAPSMLGTFPMPDQTKPTFLLFKAYVELISRFRWKSYTILYEDNQGLVRLQELLKSPTVDGDHQDIKISVRQLPHGDDYRWELIIRELEDCASLVFLFLRWKERYALAHKDVEKSAKTSSFIWRRFGGEGRHGEIHTSRWRERKREGREGRVGSVRANAYPNRIMERRANAVDGARRGCVGSFWRRTLPDLRLSLGS